MREATEAARLPRHCDTYYSKSTSCQNNGGRREGARTEAETSCFCASPSSGSSPRACAGPCGTRCSEASVGWAATDGGSRRATAGRCSAATGSSTCARSGSGPGPGSETSVGTRAKTELCAPCPGFVRGARGACRRRRRWVARGSDVDAAREKEGFGETRGSEEESCPGRHAVVRCGQRVRVHQACEYTCTRLRQLSTPALGCGSLQRPPAYMPDCQRCVRVCGCPCSVDAGPIIRVCSCWGTAAHTGYLRPQGCRASFG